MDPTEKQLLHDIHGAVSELRGEVRGMKDSIDKTTLRHEKRLNAHAVDIRTLHTAETKRRAILGAALFIITLASGAGTTAWAFVQDVFSG